MIRAVFLLGVILFAAGRNIAQEENASAEEIEEAQETAQRFVSGMQQTRDVATLFDELFFPNFVSHFVSDEFATLSLYSRLNQTERQRLFIVMYNLAYVSSVTVISDHEDMNFVLGEIDSNPRMLFPHATLLKLKGALRLLGEGENRIANYRELRAFLPAMEKALAEARTYLKRRGLEQTPQFQKELAPRNGLGSGVDYRVRTYIGGRDIKDCEPLVGFPENQKFFRVELPLFIGAILVKDGRRMKIVRLTYVDGD